MVALPEEFVKTTRQLMGEERFSRYLAAFDEEAPVSIRVNPKKLRMKNEESAAAMPSPTGLAEGDSSFFILHSSFGKVPWCRHAYYLSERPNFTFDPLLHAGCYYVQEAASMFLDHVLLSVESLLLSDVTQHLVALDMCAAPGGKSTLMRSALPEGSVLYSNEPVPKRASILLENITKWGWPDCVVTNSYPRDYVRSGLKFDIILCDVPCSGEGMIRKDTQTIGEWSPQNVEKCWRLQRDIVSDAWACLNDGGLLIYSTCTFNTKENEENIRWILETFDAEVLPVDVEAGWGITDSLLPGFNEPVYRFIPGITRSEGLFMAVLRKGGKRREESGKRNEEKGERREKSGKRREECLRILTPPSTINPQPSALKPPPSIDLSYQQTISYLQRQALQLPPDTPLGLVQVCYQGHPLGMVKNLGTRANNLYPKEWAIKSTHVPSSPQFPTFLLS